MDNKAFDLDGDYYLSAEYSTDGTDPWLGTSYVLRNWLNNWFASRCCGKTEEPDEEVAQCPERR